MGEQLDYADLACTALLVHTYSVELTDLCPEEV